MRIYLVYFLIVVGLMAASGARAGQPCDAPQEGHGAPHEMMNTSLR